MPRRRTRRGSERIRLSAECDVLICGASFAGLAAARELAGSGARVMLLDRYEIGERQTSACAAPTAWLEAMEVGDTIRQTFGDLVIHTPHAGIRMALPWTFSTFDYPSLCARLFEQCDALFETATVRGRSSSPRSHLISVQTDRGEIAAPLVVDAMGWRRVLAPEGGGYQPPAAPLSRGLEVHPWGAGEDLEVWIDRRYVPAGYGWSFPAGEELRIGVGSFDPRYHVRETTELLARDLERDSVRYQGNWIPHRLREATAEGIFFCGDSAGHCLPLTAEGIRTAFYFGIACGREVRRVIEGDTPRAAALERYGDFSDRHRWKFEAMLRVQRLVPRMPPRLLALALRAMSSRSFVHWSFNHYLAIAPPSFVGAQAPPSRGMPLARAA